MAQSLALEDILEADVTALLVAAGLTCHRQHEDLGKNPSYAGGRVAVGASLRGDSLESGTGGSGYYEVDLLVDCQTYLDDDATGSAARALAAAVRDVLHTSDVLDQLNSVSTYATYHGFFNGPSSQDQEGRLRHLALSFTVVFNPLNATTTTTTTTTTT